MFLTDLGRTGILAEGHSTVPMLHGKVGLKRKQPNTKHSTRANAFILREGRGDTAAASRSPLVLFCVPFNGDGGGYSDSSSSRMGPKWPKNCETDPTTTIWTKEGMDMRWDGPAEENFLLLSTATANDRTS